MLYKEKPEIISGFDAKIAWEGNTWPWEPQP